ncbi:hypothetical protein [Spirosoma arcticum]
METDPFNDSIRRKLESIRPDFEEKDWKRMQATLQQATPPPSGIHTTPHPFTISRTARPWLMAAATVSAVVLVSFAAWQRAQISDLRQTLSQLRQQQTARSRQALLKTAAPNAERLPSDGQTARRNEVPANPVGQPANRGQATANRTDTVYITRSVPVPAHPANPALDRVAQRSANAPAESSADRADRVRLSAKAQPQQRQSTRSTASDQRNDVAENTSPVADETTNAPDNTSPVANGTINAVTNDTRNTTRNRPGRTKSTTRRTDERTAMRSGTQRDNTAPGREKRPSVTASTDSRTTSNGLPMTASDKSTGEIVPAEGVTNQPTATYELAASRPLTTKSVDWNQALSRQTKRMQPVRTTTVGGQAAPVSQPASQPVRVAFGFRVGAGGEVSRTVQSGGLQTELLIGKHLTLGVGVGMASFAGGTFPTDLEFDRRKPKKFKQFKYNYGGGINPLSKIVGIEIQTVRVQIPVSLGYRIPVSQTLSLLPSVGTTLSFQSKEFVTFTERHPWRGDQTGSRTTVQPEDLLQNLTFGTGLEWKRKHWAVQAGPVVTVPLVADANWEESTSVGLRARVFYQF